MRYSRDRYRETELKREPWLVLSAFAALTLTALALGVVTVLVAHSM